MFHRATTLTLSTENSYGTGMPTKKRFTDDSFKKEPWFRSLCSAFLACKTEDDVANFLRDVGTLSELQSFSERFEVARLLVSGMSYREVAAKTGASTTTVTRVAKFIENGSGGYRAILHAHRHHRIHHADGKINNSNSALTEDKKTTITPLQKYLQKY
jgi:TrpR-related protein YerC/YecD